MFKKIIYSLFCLLLVGLLEFPAVAKSQAAQSLHVNLLKPQWSRSLKSGSSKQKYFPEVSSPIADDQTLYVGTHSSIFYALDRVSGVVRWQFMSNGPIASPATLDESRVYFGNNKGTVYALDKASGTIIWKYYVGSEVLSQPSVDQGVVYVVTTSREIYALDAATGKQRWGRFIRGYESKFTMRGTSAVHVDHGSLFVGFADGQLVSLSASSGKTLWDKNLVVKHASFKDLDSALIVDGGYVYASGYFGSLVKLKRSNGQIVWRKEFASGTKIAMDLEKLYLSTNMGHVIAVDKSSGIRQWDLSLNSGTLSHPYLAAGYVFVGTEKGKLFVIDSTSGKAVQDLNVSGGYYGSGLAIHNQFFILSGYSKLLSFQVGAGNKLDIAGK